MAPLTDLTWQQLADELPAGSLIVEPAAGAIPAKVMIDVSVAAALSASALSDDGVIKFFSMLFTAANKAQTEANATQAVGEKLAAFNSATVGTGVNGYIPLTRSFVCRSELATATNIIGPNQ